MASQLGQLSPAPWGASPTSSANRRIRRADDDAPTRSTAAARHGHRREPQPGQLRAGGSMGGIVRFVGAEQVAGFVGSAASDAPQPEATRARSSPGGRSSLAPRVQRAACGRSSGANAVRTPKPPSAATMGWAASPTPRAPGMRRQGWPPATPGVNHHRQARERAAAHPVPTREQYAVEIAERRLRHRGPGTGRTA